MKSIDAVSIMTLHSAKGLEFETVFLPGWEEGLFPHQRALDEGGRSGLEEERRLAYVGMTRAKRRCHIWFVSNRRIHGLWQSTMPSRFLDELPPAHVRCRRNRTILWRLRSRRLRPVALRQAGTLRQHLFDTRLETRPGQQDRRHPRQLGQPLRPSRSNASAMAKAARKARTIDGELVAKSKIDDAFANSPSATASSTSNSATAISPRSKATN